ncbi:hypothetical protein BJX61DRAFT_544025 [Aspergillus egyptiacus]|nr:hypothetical protein BJX61DRAFT_544025 [Aspergillus egyptiacus]
MHVSSILSAVLTESAVLLPAAVQAAAIKAADPPCTFTLSILRNGNWDGLSTSCKMIIYPGHVYPEGWTLLDGSAQKEISCQVDGACDTLDYHGYTHEFCHTGMDSDASVDACSVQMRGAEFSNNIWPSGNHWTDNSNSPVHSFRGHTYYKHGTCPQ